MSATASAPDLNSPSAIDNEISAYRAIHPRAVAALVLGILSVMSFASGYFLAFAVLAIILGFTADRKIQRFPDVFTGRGIAQAGVGLGLIFGLCSVSIDAVQGLVRKTQASACANEYLTHLKSDTLEQLMWLSQPPVRRTGTPEAMIESMKKDPEGQQRFEMGFTGLRELKRVLALPGAEIHYEGVENHGLDGLSPYAGAVFEVHVPKAELPEERERFAHILMKSSKNPKTKQDEWYVETITFPYKRASFKVAEKPVDDGHGHGAGGH